MEGNAAEISLQSQPERQTQPPDKLTQLFVEVRARVNDSIQRANSLINPLKPVTKFQKEPKKLNPKAVIDNLKALRHEENLSPTDFIFRSKRALQEAASLTGQLVSEETSLEDKSKQRIKRVPVAVEIIRQKWFRRRLEANQDFQTEIYAWQEFVYKKEKGLISHEIESEIEAIKAQYEKLKQEVIDDEPLAEEVRDAYIQNKIAPVVERSVEERELPSEQRAAFYKALKDYLVNREAPTEQRSQYKEDLYKFFAFEAGFWQVEDYCKPLFMNEDKTIGRDLINQMAATAAAEIKETFHKVYGQGGAEAAGHSPTFPDMDFWQALKSSKRAQELFGGTIQEQDQKFYDLILNKSLSDTEGGYIDKLYYYPTSEAIRNLVVIAAAEYENYRTVHANWCLTRLSKRDDWKQILGEAETVYPSLKTARPVLEAWNFKEYYTHPEVRSAAGLTSFLFKETNLDPRITKLATSALPNNIILDALVEKEIVHGSEAEIIIKAESFLEKYSKENWDRRFDSFPFINELRQRLLGVLLEGEKKDGSQHLEVVRRLGTLARLILDNKEDNQVLNFLTDDKVIKKLQDFSLKPEELMLFLGSYKEFPSLTAESRLLELFCNQFAGKPTIQFFKEVIAAYSGLKEPMIAIIELVGEKKLSEARALELPVKAKEVFESDQFSTATEFPELFLETDDGLEFLNQLKTSSLFSLDQGLDLVIGAKIRSLQRERVQNFLEFSAEGLNFRELMIKISPRELEQLDKLLASDTPIEINQQNWQQLLMGYVRSQADVGRSQQLSQVSIERIKELFNDPKTKDIILNGLRNSWLQYLKSGNPDEVPFSLNLLFEFIDYCGGVGPLSQIESLDLLIGSVNQIFLRPTTAEKTKLEILQGLAGTEERFTKERWSNEDKTDFYNITRDILTAAPSLFSDYLALFEKLSPAQMRLFAKDIFPLYRTKLVLIEKQEENGDLTHDRAELLRIRRDIRDFAFENKKEQLFEEVKGLFQDRFGIIKVPQELSLENTRSFSNISTYLANLQGRTSDQETVLGFYLSVMMNDRWDAFRSGETINASEFLTPEKSQAINKLLQKRQGLNPLTANSLGILQEEVPEFLRLLQQETQNMVIGNIETIDVKLTNIILNLRGLEDVDLYPELMDKQRLQLLLNWGNKKTGSVVAKMYQSLTSPGKAIGFSEEDTKIRQQITLTMKELSLSLTQQTLKEYFQDGIKPLATVVNLLNFIEETRAESEVTTLRELLKPSEQVIQIFRRLGEDFQPTSGAMALSQDLSYLDNLIVKREDQLTPEEKDLLTGYTVSIRDQMVRLEGIYGQIKNKFGSFKQGNVAQKNPLLKDKLDQVDRIINAQTTQQTITSTATNNLNTIVENIRACLSCTSEGSNNDTNLTFGDMNKLYLYSQSETQQKGSISDQIVFIEPVIRADGSQGIAFVLDRIYGTNTPTILENQVEVILKKYRAIKQRFSKIQLLVFLTEAAISTGGASVEMMQEKFKQKNISAEREQVEVEVIESVFGDHYVEFGGSARTAGKRQVKGLILSE